MNFKLMEDTNKEYMSKCIELGKIALKNGNPPVGAIIVSDGQIIGRGIESGKSTGDITNHAEILAIRDVVQNGKEHLLRQSIMYTTHEPCIMCSYLIRHHKIPHIVYSLPVNFIGGHTSELAVLKTESVPKWGKRPKVSTGVCELESRNLNREFEKLLNQKS